MKLRDFVANSLPRVRGRKKKCQSQKTSVADIKERADTNSSEISQPLSGSDHGFPNQSQDKDPFLQPSSQGERTSISGTESDFYATYLNTSLDETRYFSTKEVSAFLTDNEKNSLLIYSSDSERYRRGNASKSRSRIRTNPWLPSPSSSPYNALHSFPEACLPSLSTSPYNAVSLPEANSLSLSSSPYNAVSYPDANSLSPSSSPYNALDSFQEANSHEACLRTNDLHNTDSDKDVTMELADISPTTPGSTDSGFKSSIASDIHIETPPPSKPKSTNSKKHRREKTKSQMIGSTEWADDSEFKGQKFCVRSQTTCDIDKTVQKNLLGNLEKIRWRNHEDLTSPTIGDISCFEWEQEDCCATLFPSHEALSRNMFVNRSGMAYPVHNISFEYEENLENQLENPTAKRDPSNASIAELLREDVNQGNIAMVEMVGENFDSNCDPGNVAITQIMHDNFQFEADYNVAISQLVHENSKCNQAYNVASDEFMHENSNSNCDSSDVALVQLIRENSNNNCNHHNIVKSELLHDNDNMYETFDKKQHCSNVVNTENDTMYKTLSTKQHHSNIVNADPLNENDNMYKTLSTKQDHCNIAMAEHEDVTKDVAVQTDFDDADDSDWMTTSSFDETLETLSESPRKMSLISDCMQESTDTGYSSLTRDGVLDFYEENELVVNKENLMKSGLDIWLDDKAHLMNDCSSKEKVVKGGLDIWFDDKEHFGKGCIIKEKVMTNGLDICFDEKQHFGNDCSKMNQSWNDNCEGQKNMIQNEMVGCKTENFEEEEDMISQNGMVHPRKEIYTLFQNNNQTWSVSPEENSQSNTFFDMTSSVYIPSADWTPIQNPFTNRQHSPIRAGSSGKKAKQSYLPVIESSPIIKKPMEHGLTELQSDTTRVCTVKEKRPHQTRPDILAYSQRITLDNSFSSLDSDVLSSPQAASTPTSENIKNKSNILETNSSQIGTEKSCNLETNNSQIEQNQVTKSYKSEDNKLWDSLDDINSQLDSTNNCIIRSKKSEGHKSRDNLDDIYSQLGTANKKMEGNNPIGKLHAISHQFGTSNKKLESKKQREILNDFNPRIGTTNDSATSLKKTESCKQRDNLDSINSKIGAVNNCVKKSYKTEGRKSRNNLDSIKDQLTAANRKSESQKTRDNIDCINHQLITANKKTNGLKPWDNIENINHQLGSTNKKTESRKTPDNLDSINHQLSSNKKAESHKLRKNIDSYNHQLSSNQKPESRNLRDNIDSINHQLSSNKKPESRKPRDNLDAIREYLGYASFEDFYFARQCPPLSTGRTLNQIKSSLEEKVDQLRQEKLLVEMKISEAQEEEKARRQQVAKFQQKLHLHRKHLLVQTLHDLKEKLENQSDRLQKSYSTILSLQHRFARQSSYPPLSLLKSGPV